ncbi:MAG: IgA Peptidase M64 [Gemmatimonadales bacterium]
MRTRLVIPFVSFASILFLALSFPANPGGQGPPFEESFDKKTMRVDYYHTGDAAHEVLSLERVVSDGPWAGSHRRLIDDTNFGKYMFEVLDDATGQRLYSRGFASLYGEWETTSEAKSMHRTFHESLRFPWPKSPVRVVVKKRDDLTSFHEIGSFAIDPSARSVNRADLAPLGKVWTVFESGPPGEKVDLVLLGEGYTEEELPKFHADAKRLVDELFSTEPFKRRKSDFNVRAIDVPAAESGVSRPHAGKYRRNPAGAQYSIFDSERYLLTYDNRSLRDILSAAPYEFMGILVNEKQYGGGGIYNFQMATAVDSDFSDYVFVHEFGHHFAGLGDEYYTSDVAYETGGDEHPEPWEANITALHDPDRLKWRDLVEPGTPIPTPWDKQEFEEHSRRIRELRSELIERQAPEAEFDALFREQREIETRMLSSMEYAGKVGAFEGASYEPVGLYRPEIDCIMFTRNPVGFCRVCQRAIERVIDLYIGQ